MKHKLRCVVIGSGNMGQKHARIYSEIADLIAVSDIDSVNGQKIANIYKIRYYKNYLEMLNTEKPDAVTVATPTNTHKSIAIECLKRKIPTLVEKPIAKSIEDAKDIINIAKENNTLLLIGHIERFNPAVRKVKELITMGKLGNVINVMARRVGGFPAQIRDVDIAVDLAIHDIDIINYLLEENPIKIITNKHRVHVLNREDSSEFFMLYSKTSAFIQTSWISCVKIRKLNITGSDGYLEMDYINQEITYYKSKYRKFWNTFMGYSDFILQFANPKVQQILITKKEPLKEELKYFLKCIRNKQLVDADYALIALKIALGKWPN